MYSGSDNAEFRKRHCNTFESSSGIISGCNPITHFTLHVHAYGELQGVASADRFNLNQTNVVLT